MHAPETFSSSQTPKQHPHYSDHRQFSFGSVIMGKTVQYFSVVVILDPAIINLLLANM